MDIITKLTKVLEERKKADPNMSYVKELYKNGTDKILKKIEEETLELINATREVGSDREKRMIEETADLWFHTMVLLANENIDTRKILKELEDRFCIYGIVEKSSRKENI